MKKKKATKVSKIRIAVPDYFMHGLSEELKNELGHEFEVLDAKNKPQNVLLSYTIKGGPCGPDSFTIKGKFVNLLYAAPAIENIVSILKAMIENMRWDFIPSHSDKDNLNRIVENLQESTS